MGRLFGTDGVRGVANVGLNSELAYKLGQAGAYVLTSEVHKARILIGRDTRISGDMLEAALVAGITSVGAEAMVVGVAPTSAVAYLSRHTEADAGIMISASHNTFEYNGIKFFDGNGFKLSDSIEDRIESIAVGGAEEIPYRTGADIGRRVVLKNSLEEYREFLISTTDTRLNGIKVVLDCAHGSASVIAHKVFESLGAETIPYYNTPDGCNINDYCGSTHPDMLTQLVAEQGADLGLAFDGDADRLIAVDEHGVITDGDKIMAICAIDLKERGLLKNNTLVGTVMSNLGLEICMKNHGIDFVKTRVGDRYVLEEMLQKGYSLGGEQSGHIIFLDHNTTGDGLLTGIQIVSIMARTGKPLSQLGSCVRILPQVLVNAKVAEHKKNAYDKDEEILSTMRSLEEAYAGNGRVLIRPSGTEPLIRVMIEGEDKAKIEKEAVSLARLIEKKLGE